MILLHPYAQRLRTGLPNPKTPPVGWWEPIIASLEEPIVQIGVTGETPLVADFRSDLPWADIAVLVRRCSFWLSADSFLPHLAAHESTPGVVIWSVSDPLIFGYRRNLNLLKDRAHLRKSQFDIWESQAYAVDAFMEPRAVIASIAAWQVNREDALMMEQA